MTRAGLWSIVLLTTVAFNLFHGPWETASWLAKIHEIAEEMMRSLPASSPPFQALYDMMRSGMGVPEGGDPDQRRHVWDMVFSSEAYKNKGSKVSLRRWYAWIAAADEYVMVWHARLLAIIVMG